MAEPKATLKPFHDSLAALSLIAQREAGAVGYALFQRNRDDGELVRREQGGLEIPRSAVSAVLAGSVNAALHIYPLGNGEGLLALVFEKGTRDTPAPIVEAIRAVWAAAERAGQYSQLASEVADLELRLMDSKIADRANGLVQQRDAGSIEAISRHVKTILQPPPPAWRVLEQLTRDLEQEVEERRLTARAKTILQSSQRMSEDEAYAQLRRLSRQSRRPLREVAAEIIEQDASHSATPKEHAC